MASDRRWTDRLIDALEGPIFFRAPILLVVAGALTLCLSFVLGIDSVHDPRSGREVGFAHSPYWTAIFLVFLPLGTLGLAFLMRVLRRLFTTLHERSMVLDTTRGEPTERARDVESSWRSSLRKALPWLMLFGVVTVGMTVHECWRESYHPLFELGTAEALYHRNATEPGQAVPMSWATAALASPPETVGREVNFAFNVAAWTIQLVGKLLSVLFLVIAVTLAVWLLRHGLGFARLRIVPDLADSDPRLGFQRFELSAALLFGLAALSLPMLWLVVVHNLYLTHADGISSLWELVFTYGDEPVAALLDTSATDDAGVFWPRRVGLALILLGCALVVGLAIPVVMRSARAFALDRLDDTEPAAFERRYGIGPAEARERLRGMPAWPYRFVSLPQFCLFVVLGILSLWLFRLAPFAFLALLGIFALRAGALLRAEAPTRSDGRSYPRYLVPALAALAIVALLLVGRSMRTEPAARGVVPVVPANRQEAYRNAYDASHALLIGIGYDGSEGFPELPNAQRDVAKLDTLLRRTASDWKIRTLIGAQATRDNIMDALGMLVKTAGRDDRIFIFFAGHAVKHRERSGWIIPVDAVPGSRDPGRKRMIRFDEFTNFFWDTRAKHVLVALDSCYSGRATRGAPSEIASEKYLTAKSHVVIASGRPNEVVSDGHAGEHSPFARAFLDTLEAADTEIPVATLYGEIQRAFLQVRGQTPQISYHQQEGQFLFSPPKR